MSYEKGYGKLYDKLDSGVKEIVRALHQCKVDTVMSCEGHKKGCEADGSFPHLMYVEITPQVYRKHQKKFKRVVRLMRNIVSIRMIIDPTVRGDDHFFIVGRWFDQDDLVKAIHRAWR